MTNIKLPPSAAEVLGSTYSSLTHHLKLNHKQRRKLWKRQKRRKKRIINFFAQKALQDVFSEDSELSDEGELSNSLPIGPLTNSVVISHLKSVCLVESAKDKIHCDVGTGILKNANNFESKTQQKFPEIQPVAVSETVQEDAGSPNLPVMESESHETIVEEQLLKNEIEKLPADITGRTGKSDDSPETSRPKNEADEISDLLTQLDEEVERWQNPFAPPDVEPPQIIEKPYTDIAHNYNETDATDKRPVCIFYAKVGACRFGDKCSRKHETVDLSNTLLFPNMFQTFMFEMEDRSKITGDAHDLSLEHSEQDLYDEFLEFLTDIEPEFQQIGKVLHLFVCSNRVRHLRGNVYVQYDDANTAKQCHDKMLGRYYSGKPLFCKFVRVSSWNSAICGLHMRRNACSRGGQCNYLHVFKTNSLSHRDRNVSSSYQHRRGWNRPDYRPRFHRKHRSRSRSYSPRPRGERRSRYKKKRPRRSSSERDSSRSRSSSSSPYYRSSSRSSSKKRKGRSSSHHKKSTSRRHFYRKSAPKWVEKIHTSKIESSRKNVSFSVRSNLIPVEGSDRKSISEQHSPSYGLSDKDDGDSTVDREISKKSTKKHKKKKKKTKSTKMQN